jgi:hypothetical protein
VRLAAVLMLAALAAAPAQAQPGPDPIDALLRPPPKDADVEEPDTAATGSAVEPDPTLPAAPQAYRPYIPPPRPTLTAPVFVNETGKNPDAPPTPTEAAYDSRLRSSAASVRGFQGPMEGGWTLAAGGRPLYAFQLVDKNGSVEGAWRDLRRTGALNASGFFDIVERTGGDLTFRFDGGGVAVLRPDGGRWSGQLTEGGHSEAVSLIRQPAP